MDYQDGKKPRKVPLQRNGDFGANYNEPSAWRSFDEAIDEATRRGGMGVGFVFSSSDNIVGVDLDNAYDENGILHQWAREVVASFPHAYCEATPSGNGLHIVGYAGKVVGKTRVDLGGSGIERYSENRWFTFTGQPVWDGEMRDISDGMAWLADAYFGGIKEQEKIEKRLEYQQDEARDVMLARVCLEKISPSRANSGDDWRAVGYACKGTSEQLKEDWIKWSSTWPEFDREECEDRWKRFDSKSGVGTLVHMASADSGCSSLSIIDEAAKRLKPVEVVDEFKPKRTTTLTDAIDEWARMEEMPCIPTSLPSINELFGGGIPVGQMTALAAAPGLGKSALAMHLALDCLDRNPDMVAMWCLGEMTKSSLAARAIANFGGMDNNLKLRDVIDKKEPSRKIGASLAMKIGDRLKLVESPLHIEKIAEAVDRDGPKLLIVDYLQLVRSGRNYNDKTAEINECLLCLREITTTRNIATILVTNIAKGVNEATEIGNIGKGSNQIDFDVDNLIFGHRMNETAGDCEKVNWACKKLRQGQMRDVPLWFHGPYQWFEDTVAVPQADPALTNVDWSAF